MATVTAGFPDLPWTEQVAGDVSSAVFGETVGVAPTEAVDETSLFITDSVAENKRRRKRIVMEGKPSCTISDIVAAVGSFERWLWALPVNDHREIFQISPEELDEYLVSFFASVKSRAGRDYTPHSFKNLRSRLDSYLRDNNYPCSITKSSIFCKSQVAYKRRRKMLADAASGVTRPDLN